MRADRVLAMAENRFGKRFASKEAAIAELQTLSQREQRSLKKVETSKAERARRSGASERMISAMAKSSTVKLPSASVQSASERLTKALGTSAFPAELAAVTKGMKAGEVKALAKQFASSSASSKEKALKAIASRHNDLGIARAASRATGGRIAGAIALAVGVGSVLADSLGSDVMAAEKKRRNQGPSKNTVAAKEADAKAKQAEAAAEQAKAETRRLELEAQARRDKREDDRRDADKAPLEQARQIGLVAVPLAAGTAYGVHKANKIQAHVEKSVAAKNSQLTSVARRVQGSKSPAKLAAAVKTADDLKLTKMKTPIGLLPAGFLLAEAVTARVIAAHTENETASEVLNSAAIGLSAAAITTVGARLAEKIAPTVQLNAGAIMEINTARETLKASGEKPAKPAGSGKGGRLLKSAGRLAFPALVAVATAAAFSEARAEGADNVKATKQAAKAGGDVVLGGAISEYDAAKARGAGEAEAVAIGTSKGAINLATFGVAEMANDALADKGGVAGAITDTVTTAASKVGKLLGWSDEARMASANVRAQGKAFLNAGAERKAEQVPKAPASTVVAASAVQQRSDGQTEAYTRRTKSGTTVQVKGYRTPTAR